MFHISQIVEAVELLDANILPVVDSSSPLGSTIHRQKGLIPQDSDRKKLKIAQFFFFLIIHFRPFTREVESVKVQDVQNGDHLL